MNNNTNRLCDEAFENNERSSESMLLEGKSPGEIDRAISNLYWYGSIFSPDECETECHDEVYRGFDGQ